MLTTNGRLEGVFSVTWMQEKAPRYLANNFFHCAQHTYPAYSSRNVRVNSLAGVSPTNQLRVATRPLFNPKRHHVANVRNVKEAGPSGHRVSTITASGVHSKLTGQPREAFSRSSTLNAPPERKNTTTEGPKLCPCP